jgi:hypothetical protein
MFVSFAPLRTELYEFLLFGLAIDVRFTDRSTQAENPPKSGLCIRYLIAIECKESQGENVKGRAGCGTP